MTILEYSEQNLSKVLSNKFTSTEVIEKKAHYLYFKDYFGSNGIGAKTMVLEDEYISKDYLDDYSSYYSYCFEKYDKFCTRVHFFSKNFDLKEFKVSILDGSNSTNLWDSYLGFIVVKPIPLTTIGITILKTYPYNEAKYSRKFWGTRKYKIHVFGKKIEIDSLAFQEQDNVVSACATTAIWTMLNKASDNNYASFKSPHRITEDADVISPNGSRLFPNKGLNILQISKAIQNSGLVSEIKEPDSIIKTITNKELKGKKTLSNSYLKKVVNAYSHVGIPIILIIRVPNGKKYGLHAITVSGHKKGNYQRIESREEISYHANSIERLYVHDDQWGPFARLKFDGDIELNTPWTEFDKEKRPTYVSNIIVPLYPKIRISYEEIDVITLGLNTLLTLFFENKIKADLIWNIRLRYSQEFKSDVRDSMLLSNPEKIKVLKQNMPKYIWDVSCRISNLKIFDFAYDATGLRNDMIGSEVLCYLPPTLKEELNEFLKLNQKKLEDIFRHKATKRYYNFLIEKIS